MTALHLAKLDDLDRLEPLVAAYHAYDGTQSTSESRRKSLTLLLEGTPHGAAYLIGMRRAPVGYIVISFGFSVALGGIDGSLDEFYIRESVRGRGMGSEVLNGLTTELGRHGVKALTLQIKPAHEKALRVYTRSGFKMRDGYSLMTKTF